MVVRTIEIKAFQSFAEIAYTRPSTVPSGSTSPVSAMAANTMLPIAIHVRVLEKIPSNEIEPFCTAFQIGNTTDDAITPMIAYTPPELNDVTISPATSFGFAIVTPEAAKIARIDTITVYRNPGLDALNTVLFCIF